MLRPEKWRDRAIECVGDGANEFGFARLDSGIERDSFGTGSKDVLFYLRDRLSEAVEGGVEMGEVAFGRREPRDFGAGHPA